VPLLLLLFGFFLAHSRLRLLRSGVTRHQASPLDAFVLAALPFEAGLRGGQDGAASSFCTLNLYLLGNVIKPTGRYNKRLTLAAFSGPFVRNGCRL